MRLLSFWQKNAVEVTILTGKIAFMSKATVIYYSNNAQMCMIPF